jgi:predicted TIM-barrel fold metal-dependent hydrolase
LDEEQYFVIDCETHLIDDVSDLRQKGNDVDTWFNFEENFNRYIKSRDGQLLPLVDMSEYTLEELVQTLFVSSETEMAFIMSQDFSKIFSRMHFDPEHAADAHRKYPDRIIPCGQLPVLEGEKGLEYVEHQVKNLGIKAWGEVCQAVDPHSSVSGWRCDDEKLAYPFWEKCVELGVRTIILHKGVLLPPNLQKWGNPQDIPAAAVNFPELNFVITHLGVPWWEEASWIVGMYDNVYSCASVFWDYIRLRPGWFLPRFAEFFHGGGGAEKMIWGTDLPTSGTTQCLIEMFKKFQFPPKMRREYDLPELTPEDKRKIFGENLAKLLGINIEEQRKKIAEDEIAQRRAKVLTPEIKMMLKKEYITLPELYGIIKKKGISGVGEDFLDHSKTN